MSQATRAVESTPFGLKAFNPENAPAIAITGTVQRFPKTLQLTYQLKDPNSLVARPIPVQKPERRDELWQTTCFELFLGVVGSDRYWEFNLSPAGHWNLYRFEDYRQGMNQETAITQIPVTLQADPLSVELDLSLIGVAKADLELGITAVIETQTGAISYWAMAHTGPEADFHRRDSFVLKL